METLEKIKMALLFIIPAGAAARIAYCAFCAAADESNKDKMKQRIKNILIFVAIAMSLTAIASMFMVYYPMDAF